MRPLEGNFQAKRRVTYIQNLLTEIGLEAKRIKMYNVSAAMAGEFVTQAKEMDETIQALGSNPLRDDV